MGKSLSTLVQEEFVIIYGGTFKTTWRGFNGFNEGLNSDCHTFLICKDTLLTEEQIKAHHHDFFIRRYNIDVDPVERLNLLGMMEY